MKALVRLFSPFQDDAPPPAGAVPSSPSSTPASPPKRPPTSASPCGFNSRLLNEQLKPLLHAISLLDIDLQVGILFFFFKDWKKQHNNHIYIHTTPPPCSNLLTVYMRH